MAISLDQCGLLNVGYTQALTAMASLVKTPVAIIRTIEDELLAINDLALDFITDQLAAIDVPTGTSMMGNIINNMENAINECPALALVLPSAVADITLPDINKLPSILKTRISEMVVSAADDLIKAAISGPQYAAMAAIYSYEKMLIASPIPRILSNMAQFEACMTALCGLVVDPGQSVSHYRAQMILATDYTVDIAYFATHNTPVLSIVKLNAAYSSFKSKYLIT